jgi:hypothetical protein
MESQIAHLRPILPTASAAMLGTVPVIIDLIASKLAWSPIFGLFASIVLTLLVTQTACRRAVFCPAGGGRTSHVPESIEGGLMVRQQAHDAGRQPCARVAPAKGYGYPTTILGCSR